jgi:hypothetical protein
VSHHPSDVITVHEITAGGGAIRDKFAGMTSRESKGARLRVGQTTAWSIKQTASIATRQRNGTRHSTRQPNECTDIDRSNTIGMTSCVAII